MTQLNKIIAYWYDCIKNEDILEKDISINVRTKAILYPFENDLFIFNKRDNLVSVSENERLCTFSEYISVNRWEAYYGYPMLFYFDDNSQKYHVYGGLRNDSCKKAKSQ